jgi:hypothetical protein
MEVSFERWLCLFGHLIFIHMFLEKVGSLFLIPCKQHNSFAVVFGLENVLWFQIQPTCGMNGITAT